MSRVLNAVGTHTYSVKDKNFQHGCESYSFVYFFICIYFLFFLSLLSTRLTCTVQVTNQYIKYFTEEICLSGFTDTAMTREISRMFTCFVWKRYKNLSGQKYIKMFDQIEYLIKTDLIKVSKITRRTRVNTAPQSQHIC